MEKKHSPALFDAIAPTYDKVNQVLSLGLHHSWRARVAKKLPNTSNLNLLDCATGTCDQLIACLKKRSNIHSAVGIDLAENMLLLGQKKLAQTPYNYKVRLEKASLCDIPYAAGSFDAATLSFGIRNIEDPVEGLREIHRVLTLGGTLLVLEFSRSFLPLHLWYLRNIVPKIGTWLSGHKSAYSYLNTTIESFPSGDSFCALLKQAGFQSVTCTPLTGGIVSIYDAKK